MTSKKSFQKGFSMIEVVIGAFIFLTVLVASFSLYKYLLTIERDTNNVSDVAILQRSALNLAESIIKIQGWENFYDTYVSTTDVQKGPYYPVREIDGSYTLSLIPKVISNGIALYLPLNEGKDTTAYDASSEDNNGTLVGNPQWAMGKHGQAVSFAGNGNDQKINLEDPITLQNNSSWTLSYWFYHDDTSSTNKSMGTENSGLSFIDHSQVGNNYTLRLVNTTGDIFECKPNINLRNAWHHVAFIATPQDSGNQLTCFIDGEQVTSNNIDSTEFSISMIGNAGNNDSYTWKGRLDDIRVYRKALLFSEIQDILTPVGSPVEPSIIENQPDSHTWEISFAQDATLGPSIEKMIKTNTGYDITFSQNMNNAVNGLPDLLLQIINNPENTWGTALFSMANDTLSITTTDKTTTAYPDRIKPSSEIKDTDDNSDITYTKGILIPQNEGETTLGYPQLIKVVVTVKTNGVSYPISTYISYEK